MLKPATIALLGLSWPSAAAAHEETHDSATQVPGANNATVTLVYQHALPGVPGKSMKGVIVEYGPGGEPQAQAFR